MKTVAVVACLCLTGCVHLGKQAWPSREDVNAWRIDRRADEAQYGCYKANYHRREMCLKRHAEQL